MPENAPNKKGKSKPLSFFESQKTESYVMPNEGGEESSYQIDINNNGESPERGRTSEIADTDPTKSPAML